MVVIDSLGQGGAEESLRSILPLVTSEDLHIELVLRQSTEPEKERALRDAGIPVTYLDCHPSPLAIGRALRRLLKQESPDVLHLNLFGPIVGGSLGAIGSGVKVLASQVNTPTVDRSGQELAAGSPWKVRTAQSLEAFVLRNFVTHVHAVTEGVAKCVEDDLGVDRHKISVSERGRDPERFYPPSASERATARKELGVAQSAYAIVALGRHDPAKGLLDLVAATAELVASLPNAIVLLAGRDGPESTRLRAAADAAELGERFRILGDRPDPEKALAAADAYVLSSKREGASGATVEAMATGLPVVATDVPGLRGITQPGVNALVVPIGDPAALSNALRELAVDQDLAERLGAAGRRSFLERFTLLRSAESMSELYRKVANQH
jgi:glycosyltransferase involved in cell wall biosynthesis